MTEILERLNESLAGRYRVERELGEGGMATVYLAEDLRHRRQVAIKVLKPELAATLGPDRFLREIEISAKLDHPHILPLYDSGDAGGLLFYVMPFVEGESLRDRLERERQLPLEEALKIAREVADALSYAHSRDVVHRDIKPANILLAGGHARVADFGIARAISEAGGGRLTRTGLAVGTLAYMSPEQAAGSEDVDGRSDLYSLGCVLFEMLAGVPPFSGPPESLVNQHLTADPQPITNLRPAVPAEVAGALMRALAKTPADRFSPAAQFAEALRLPAATAPAATPLAPAGALRSDPLRAAGVFGLASLLLLALVYLLVLQLGLPGWVFVTAIALLVIGLPMVVATSVTERQRESAVAVPRRRLLTWRNTLLGGVLAFAALGVVTVGYMSARVMGVGPAGTLMATGAIEEQERLILADFENRTEDTAHGATVTELMRIGLSQSRAVSVLDPIQVARILELMQRDPTQGLSEQTALEAAERDGIKAVVTGEITAVGTGFSISARLVTVDGQVLTAQQQVARDEDELVAAVGRLSESLRERFGESLISIRSTEPLERVTTGSMRALRVFSQGLQAWNQGDIARGMQLLEEAIALDSTFAMAHRKLAIILQNQAERRSRAIEVATKAYENRERLTERERYLVTAAYHSVVTGNRDQVISAYRTVLDMYPTDYYALNNLGVIYSELRDYERAAEYYSRALQVDSVTRLHYSNLASTLGNLKQWDSSSVIIDRFERRFPGNPEVQISRIIYAANRKDYESAEELGQVLMREQRGTVFWEGIAYEWLASLDAMRGRLDGARERWGRSFEIAERRGVLGLYLQRAARRAMVEGMLYDDAERAREILESAAERVPIEDLSPLDRPYGLLAMGYATAGDPGRARALLEEYRMTSQADHSRITELFTHGARGLIALAEGDLDEAIDAFRQYDEGNSCGTCAVAWLARAYDQAGQADSARVLYERFVEKPSDAIWYDAGHLGHGYMRLGQLHEERGDLQRAADYYGRLIDLWGAADPEFRARVAEAEEGLKRVTEGRPVA